MSNNSTIFRGSILLSGILTTFATSTMAKSGEQSQRPNILIILTDDQGYADFGCFGSQTNKTPVMDQLTQEGVSFSNFYAQPVSGSSRSALLTGRYPIRSGGRSMHSTEITLAEYAKMADYQTACIGKWDLSGRKAIKEQMPNAQGFDYYYGPLAANDRGSVALYENNELVEAKYTDMSSLLKLYTDKTIEFIKEQRDDEKPFFLYLSHTMMHVVIDASEQFKGKSDGGLYGDVVEEFDYETGRLLATLEELEIADNTIVIYATDNGPWCQTKYTQNPSYSKYYPEGAIFWGDPGALRGGKGSAYEAGSRVRCVVRWSGVIKGGRCCDGLISTLDFVPTFANVMGYSIPSDLRMDGVDQGAMVFGNSKKSARDYFHYSQHHEGLTKFAGIRDKRWKLLLPDREIQTVYLMDFGTNDYELYDLKNDISESINLADKYPKIVERLKQELNRVYE